MLAAAKSSPAPTASAEPAAAKAVALPRTPAPEGAAILFVEPTDGEEVTSPVTVTFGAVGITVVPAGDDTPASGHHHLIINAPMPDFGLPIPKNDQYLHFGAGQTETTLELAPGTYELTMLMGDHLHVPHEPPIMSDTITITVVE